MKVRKQVILDIVPQKFQHLVREENKVTKRINIIDLNKRLNKTKKSNIYYNTKIITSSIICLALISLICLKF